MRALQQALLLILVRRDKANFFVTLKKEKA